MPKRKILFMATIQKINLRAGCWHIPVTIVNCLLLSVYGNTCIKNDYQSKQMVSPLA